MHDKAKTLINIRIEKILEEYSFEKRKDNNLEECPCYISKKPCHETEGLNCLLCYCPAYDLSTEQGGCTIGNPQKKGYFLEHDSFPSGKIWDCSNCDYPHREENIKVYLEKIFGINQNP